MTGRPRKQKGAVTMFSAVLILILLTEMLLYAVQVGVFEQRKSGNEMRQKQAFHAAETGIQQANAYLLANVLDLTFAGTGGWLSDTSVSAGGSGRWVKCPLLTGVGPHPCYGEPKDSKSDVDLRGSSYFYSLDGANPSSIPMVVSDILPESTETVNVQAILCLLEIDRTAVGAPPVKGCLDKDHKDANPIYFIVTLLSRGNAECDADGDCAAEAMVAQKLGSFGPLTGAGGPGVPLTTRSSFPPSGTAEIVPNPDGGGTGVPISSWINNNDGVDPYTGYDCSTNADPLDPSGGSWTTCEMHEWYGVHAMPDENSPNGKYTCPSANCS
ncbi:PilX N-terminal domain-containing pilus assembly protein, partial [Pseudomonadota bacterium]